MEETVVVIMQKDEKTGFLQNEITSCKIMENEMYLVNIYAIKNENFYTAHIKLSLADKETELQDWQFDAIYDYYDETVFDSIVHSFSEVEDCYDPTWEVTIRFTLEDNELNSEDMVYYVDDFEVKLNEVLAIHKNELTDVFETIKDKENEYH